MFKCVCGKEFKFGIRTAVIHQVRDAVGSEYYNKALSIQSTPLGKVADKNKIMKQFEKCTPEYCANQMYLIVKKCGF